MPKGASAKFSMREKWIECMLIGLCRMLMSGKNTAAYAKKIFQGGGKRPRAAVSARLLFVIKSQAQQFP